MEICRWSRQPDAHKFMDWVWDIVTQYRQQRSSSHSDSTLTALIQSLLTKHDNALASQQQQITTITQTQQAIQQELRDDRHQQATAIAALTTLITSSMPQPYRPRFTRWMDNAFKKADIIGNFLGVTRREILHKLYVELEETYGLDLNEYQDEFCFIHNLQNTGIYTLNAINADQKLKQLFDILLDTYIEQYNTKPVATAV